MRLRDRGLVHVKTDPLLNPVPKEARFQAIERRLQHYQLTTCSRRDAVLI